MYLNIYGDYKRLSRADIRDATTFFTTDLMSARLLKNIHIKLFLETNDTTFNTTRGDFGAILIDDDLVRPREFSIYVSGRQGRLNFLRTLAHELVHVKQYAKQETINYIRKPWLTKFNGAYVDTRVVSYWDYPWEIEAYGREVGLVNKYLAYRRSVTRLH